MIILSNESTLSKLFNEQFKRQKTEMIVIRIHTQKCGSTRHIIN